MATPDAAARFDSSALQKFLEDAGPHWLVLTDDPADAPIREAFATYQLDPQKPGAWRQLLAYLAEEKFGEHRGRPKEWSGAKVGQLLKEIAQIKSQNPSSVFLSDRAIAKRLKRRPEYDQLSERRLRQLVKDALNLIEGPMTEVAIKEFSELHKTSPKQVRKLIREKALTFIIGEWKKKRP